MDGNTFYFEIEAQFMIWLQNLLGEAGKYLGTLFTVFGETMVLVVILIFIYWCYDKELGKRIGVAIVTTVAWNPLVKNVALRRRPYMDIPEIKCLKAPTTTESSVMDIAAQGYSFPSAHATNSACVYSFMALEKRKRIFKVCAVVLPFIVGLSRVMLGVHFPTDVIIGWIMGYVISFGVFFLNSKVKRRWIVNLIIFAITLIGLFYCRTEDYFSTLGVMAGVFLAMPVEEKFVKFENTRNPLFCVLRVGVGLGAFALLNYLLKLPFSEEFLHNGSLISLSVRSIRYFVIVFVLLGLYPALFKVVESRLVRKK